MSSSSLYLPSLCPLVEALVLTLSSLASVNFLLFCVGAAQSVRVLLYQQSLKKDSVPAEIEKAAKQEGRTLEAVAKDPKGALKKAENV